ncbi:uncharacterized protein LOC132643784 [Lycium barbarum]|uniref:uncharacterized protein LOC132643784 n=1 Tax=Lycium barbarum TaxID=112863 RepID=UPI00293E8CB5|nr:uncharacterized protein LOC132643784 [Lycium barbarum]
MGSLLYVPAEKLEMTKELYHLANLGVHLLDSEDTGIALQNISQSTLASDVKTQQYEDPVLVNIKERVLTKSTHFLPVRTTYAAEDYVKLYLKEIVLPYGIPLSIISDRGAQVTAKKCRSPAGWFEVGEANLFGPDLVHQAIEKVKLIQERLRTAQSCQKSYADVRRRQLSFRIVRKVGQVAYELELPSELQAVHPFFHVSMLRKCIGDPSRIVPVDDTQVTENLTYEEEPIAILDRQVHRLRNKDVASVKVLWRSKDGGRDDVGS